uniref:Spermatosis associated 1 n=1 Tax=Latimeria chalumnae TaxID=7897 RepID=H3B3E4_LATCH
MLLLPEESLVLQLVELHVFYVPDELWNPKLNTVSIEAINKFISAGFIRVYPDLTLQTLREQLGEILGEDAITDKFVFLKCVGRSLAVVKARQETQVKLKSFAPPYASQPELYLLPGVVHDGKSSCSLSVTPDRQQYITDYSGLTESSQDPRNPNFSKPESMRNATLIFEIWQTFQNGAQNCQTSNRQNQSPELYNTVSHSNILCFTNFKTICIWGNGTQCLPVEWDKCVKEQEAKYETSALQNILLGYMSFVLERISSTQHLPNVMILSSKEENIIKQLQITRQERKQLEKSREELVKKAKGLLAQNRLRRNQVRDAWKKKYFDTKKGTSSLEEMLNRLRQDQELYYQKLLQHLEARDGKKQPKNLTSAASSKNDLIIQITTEQREVDQLKRKVDNAKMKLVTELKLRKQAATELRALRAELAQKKIQSSLSRKCGGSIPQ